MRLMIVLTALLVMATACSGPGVVSADKFGSAWPLREDNASLQCIGDGDQVHIIWMRVGDYHYALNPFSERYLNRHHPKLMLRPLERVHIPGKNLFPLIDRAKSLCKA